MRHGLSIIATVFAVGCTQLPPTPQEIEAQRFEPVAGHAVLYVVRAYPDASPNAATLWLNDRIMGATYPGTFFRWVVPPGRHRIAGFAADSGRIEFDAGPDRIYFIYQSFGRMFGQFDQSHFQFIDDRYGRSLVMQARWAG